jgi:hypothetical protein
MNNINNMAISYTGLIIALVVVGVALYFFIDHKQKLNKEMKKQEDEKLMEQAKEEVKAVSLSAAPVHLDLDLEVKENFTLEDDNESDNSSDEECIQVEQQIQQNQEIEGVSSSASMPAPFVNL